MFQCPTTAFALAMRCTPDSATPTFHTWTFFTLLSPFSYKSRLQSLFLQQCTRVKFPDAVADLTNYIKGSSSAIIINFSAHVKHLRFPPSMHDDSNSANRRVALPLTCSSSIHRSLSIQSFEGFASDSGHTRPELLNLNR